MLKWNGKTSDNMSNEYGDPKPKKVYKRCPRCKGSGRTGIHTCPECKGYGDVVDYEYFPGTTFIPRHE